MKKIWKMRRDSEAVSPVIATILMVAITVVLAAVLYVMVMGFGGPTSSPPVAAMSYQKVGPNNYTIRITSIDREVLWSDCKIAIVNDSKAGTSQSPLKAGPIQLDNNVVAGIWLVDLGSASKVGAGDYFIIRTQADCVYTISLLYGTKEDAIATVTFTAT